MTKEDYPEIIDYPEGGDEEVTIIEDGPVAEDVAAPEWPVYLSLGVIAFAVIAIIFINILGSRKK